MKEAVSIFNDVLGPVMRGPSSSHTAGAYRIACIAMSLYGSIPQSVTCTFDPEGSYAPTYKALGVDKAFCIGLLGLDMLGKEYESAVSLASRRFVVKFLTEPLLINDHPNTIRIEMKGRKSYVIWARSTGGGGIEIFLFNDAPISISGKSLEYLIEVKAEKNENLHFESIMIEDARFRKTASHSFTKSVFYQYTVKSDVKRCSDVIGTELESIQKIPGIIAVHTVQPVYFPVRGRAEFRSSKEILDFSIDEGCTLGEAGMIYEQNLLGMNRFEIIDEMTMRYNIMKQSVSNGLSNNDVELAWLKPHAATIMDALNAGSLPYGGASTRAAVRALAVMHTCNSRGVVCAAPTGGSAGVLPGTVLTLEEEFSFNTKDLVRVLFAAGLIGVIIAERATFAAEIAGCQVEIGASGAMAAAAVVEAAGGSAEAALNAASIALQNTMGSVCDTVGGGCEIPCHTRNAAAAASAFTCADLIMGGYPNPIPFDEAVDASFEVGKQLPKALRCTSSGGIAVSPSAQKLIRKNPLQ